jgi:hypothetical protein
MTKEPEFDLQQAHEFSHFAQLSAAHTVQFMAVSFR